MLAYIAPWWRSSIKRPGNKPPWAMWDNQHRTLDVACRELEFPRTSSWTAWFWPWRRAAYTVLRVYLLCDILSMWIFTACGIHFVSDTYFVDRLSSTATAMIRWEGWNEMISTRNFRFDSWCFYFVQGNPNKKAKAKQNLFLYLFYIFSIWRGSSPMYEIECGWMRALLWL